jgi:hypothetical protein
LSVPCEAQKGDTVSTRRFEFEYSRDRLTEDVERLRRNATKASLLRRFFGGVEWTVSQFYVDDVVKSAERYAAAKAKFEEQEILRAIVREECGKKENR